MARSDPRPESAPQPERIPNQLNPNPFLRPKRLAGNGQGNIGRPVAGRPAHLPNPRSLPSSRPRQRPVRRGGMR